MGAADTSDPFFLIIVALVGSALGVCAMLTVGAPWFVRGFFRVVNRGTDPDAAAAVSVLDYLQGRADGLHRILRTALAEFRSTPELWAAAAAGVCASGLLFFAAAARAALALDSAALGPGGDRDALVLQVATRPDFAVAGFLTGFLSLYLSAVALDFLFQRSDGPDASMARAFEAAAARLPQILGLSAVVFTGLYLMMLLSRRVQRLAGKAWAPMLKLFTLLANSGFQTGAQLLLAVMLRENVGLGEALQRAPAAANRCRADLLVIAGAGAVLFPVVAYGVMALALAGIVLGMLGPIWYLPSGEAELVHGFLVAGAGMLVASWYAVSVFMAIDTARACAVAGAYLWTREGRLLGGFQREDFGGRPAPRPEESPAAAAGGAGPERPAPQPAMRCLRCGTGLRTEERDGTTVDACGACGGMWLDAGELNTLAGESIERDPLADARATSEPCPACGAQALEKGGVGGRLVVVDRCRVCGGVWLDARELDHIRKVLRSLA